MLEITKMIVCQEEMLNAVMGVGGTENRKKHLLKYFLCHTIIIIILIAHRAHCSSTGNRSL
jgi:hypothetical protein